MLFFGVIFSINLAQYVYLCSKILHKKFDTDSTESLKQIYNSGPKIKSDFYN